MLERKDAWRLMSDDALLLPVRQPPGNYGACCGFWLWPSSRCISSAQRGPTDSAFPVNAYAFQPAMSRRAGGMCAATVAALEGALGVAGDALAALGHLDCRARHARGHLAVCRT